MPDSKIVYLNGEFVPLAQASVSVMDRGFLFGDGVYEVIPAYGGRLFRLEQHLDRLTNSLRAIRMQNPLERARWSDILTRLIEPNPGRDQSVYLQVTRGASGTREHTIPPGIEPTVFAMSSVLEPLPAEISQGGVSAITLKDIRWQLCDVKAITLLANVLLREEARDREAMEAILIRDGFATEGAASNLFIVANRLLTTPPKGPFLLPGITRDLVLELACEHGISCSEERIGREQLETADEIWLTSSSREIMPVTRLDGNPVSGGIPGPQWQQMNALFQAYKQRLRTGG